MVSVLSYGAGVQSTALMVLLAERRALDLIVYADLGNAESPDTRLYVHNVAMPYARAVGIEFAVVSAGDLLADMLQRPEFVPVPFRIAGTGVPLKRQCTYQYKIRPIRRLLRARYNRQRIRLHLGISSEEYTRMRTSDVKYIEHSYPLVDWRLTRRDCADIVRRAGLPVPAKSSCWLCPYRSSADQEYVLNKHPYLRDWGERLEQEVNRLRRNRGADDIVVVRCSRSVQIELGLHCEGGYCDV